MTDNIDISQLGDIADAPVGYQGEDYEPSSAFAPPPTPGEYTFTRVNEEEGDFKDGAGKTSEDSKTPNVPFYWANFKVAVSGGRFEGRTGFFGVNTFTFDRKNSTADDYIRAAGSPLRPRTIREYARDIPKVAGPFRAAVNWEWRCRDCEETFLVGAFSPKRPRKYQGPKMTPKMVEVKDSEGKVTGRIAHHVQNCPGCGQECGASMVVKRFVVPTGANGVAGPAIVANKNEVAG
jgi:hypothetical protein